MWNPLHNVCSQTTRRTPQICRQEPLSTMADGKNEEPVADLALTDIIDGTNEREIPAAKFIEDLDAFAETFDPPASAELLIGAYSELHTKYKNYEMRLSQKREYKRASLVYCGAFWSDMQPVRVSSQAKDTGNGKVHCAHSILDSKARPG